MRLHPLLVIAAVSILVLGSQAQQPAPPAPGDNLIDNYLRLETAALARRFADGVQSREEWEKRRPALKEQFLDMLGLWPLPERTPLQAKITGTLERDQFRVEKVHFQSKPGLYVTGNLYLPKTSTEKHPAVLYVCGHSGRGHDGNKTAFQQHGMWFATHGYVCLMIDTLQLGEISGIHHGTYREGRWWWQALGYTPAGVECWNGIRGIDYLISRPEVDPERIAVTGISGGGATTLWIAAADERVKVAVPVSGMSDLDCYVSDKVINGHCDCMFMVNTYRWEWTTVAALVAPRPMLILNSGHDTIFPMPGNERQRRRLEAFYDWFKPAAGLNPAARSERPKTLLDIGVTPGGHSDNLELRLMAYRWINWHLKDDNAEVQEPPLPKFEGKELRAFPDELPSDALNGSIDETFIPRGKPTPPPEAKDFPRWREELIAALQAKSFREWPNHVPPAELLREESDGRLLLATEPGIGVYGRYAQKPKEAKRIVVVVLGADDEAGPQGPGIPKWSGDHVRESDLVVSLSPRGCGGLKWTRKSPPNYVERAHALLGRTVDTGRVWDVQAVVRWLHEQDVEQRPVVVAGQGQAGMIGAYAALFEPCIDEIIAVEPTIHTDGPIFLNVLRVLDTPDTLGLLAPRPLTLVNARDPGFKRTEAIYRLAGADAHLRMR